ncbi:RDD family protein [Streptomyces fractus]|uniref:RDD family protein n=1 Tax=Streptomyces fractus TaxID=641806 RepID=UPI003CEF53BE
MTAVGNGADGGEDLAVFRDSGRVLPATVSGSGSVGGQGSAVFRGFAREVPAAAAGKGPAGGQDPAVFRDSGQLVSEAVPGKGPVGGQDPAAVWDSGRAFPAAASGKGPAGEPESAAVPEAVPVGPLDTGGGGDPAAGIVSRGVGALVDAVVLAVVGLSVEVGAGCARVVVVGPPFQMPDVTNWLAGPIGWVLAVCYLGGSWAVVGATPGGRLMGVSVTDRAGRRLRTVRALVRAAVSVSFPLGLLWIPFSRRRAALPDLVVRSVVTYDRGYDG